MPEWTDIGGRPEFFGPIDHSPAEPAFHQPWEGRVFGINLFVQSLMGPNIDAARYAMERLPRGIYMSSYYRRWLGGLESELVRRGFLGSGEVDARVAGAGAEPGGKRMPRVRLAATSRMLRLMLRPRFPRWAVAHVFPRVIGTSRPALTRARFREGDRVRVRSQQAAGHTRQAAYVTGKPGVVTAHLKSTLFPDAHSTGRRARPQHLYTVAFDGADLWGAGAEPGTEIRVDLYEPYLEAR